MKLNTASVSIIAASIAVSQAAPTSSTSLQARADTKSLLQAIEDINAYKEKRDQTTDDLSKRENEIVTRVLEAVNDTNLAPRVLRYFATNQNLEPIVVRTLVAVISSGRLNLSLLFNALNDSNLVVTVIRDLVSDCSLYAELFNTARNVISNLASQVESRIRAGVSSLTDKRDDIDSASPMNDIIVERDAEDVVTSLLESLGDSGLATSVVRSILTDSAYLPFAGDLITQLLRSNALNLRELLNAVKNSGLVSNLFRQILTVDTFRTVATNAFAAFAGDCSSSTSTSTPSTGSGSGSGSSPGNSRGSSGGSGSSSGTVNPCQKKRKRRRNYIH